MYNKSIPLSAFQSQPTITSVKFGSTCTYVGKDAFKNCISLEEINDDNVIKEIYGGAFANTKLSSVNFSKLKSIIGSTIISEYGAFQNCSHLIYINMPSCTNIGTKAFYECINLENIDFKNFSRIENQAFAGCTSIENADLNKCISIGQSAFFGCTQLKEIKLSSCIIGGSAFFNCNHLSKVYITTSKVSLSGNYIFYYNSQNSGSSSSAIWPKNLLPQQSTYSIISNIRFYLRADIFNHYTNDSNSMWSVYKDYMIKLPGNNQILYTTIIKENNEENKEINIDGSKYGGIKLHKYDKNTGTGSIEFYKNVEILFEEFFKNNKVITSICLPPNCSEVGESVFEGCTSLDTFTPYPLEKVFTKIGNCAFKDCTSLKSFTIPESIESLGEGIFAGCSNIEEFEGKFVKYNGKAIVYNNTLINVAPKNNSETDELYYKISDISSNITHLGQYCFSGFSKLMRVDMISSYDTNIGDFAFEGCDNLREVHFYDRYPSGSIEFGKNAFGIFKKDENKNYVVDENKNYFKIFIPERLFSSCLDEENNSTNSWIKVYKNYIYPEPSNKQIIYYTNTSQENNSYHLIEINGDEIQKNSFGNNKDNISKIIIGEGITKITSDTFRLCKNLEYIYLPNSLKIIANRVFQECKNLKNISIPNNVESIGQYCFGNSNIIKFNINDGSKLKKISKQTFINCSNLSTVDLSKSKILNSIDNGAFYFCEKLTDVKLSNTITSIEDDAFAGCKSLSKITLPKELKSLGNHCLETGSSITKIYIPDSLSKPPIFTISGEKSDESYPFGNSFGEANELKIYVPSELCNKYKTDRYWRKYENKIFIYSNYQIDDDIPSIDR